MPPLRAHLDRAQGPVTPPLAFARRPVALLSLGATAASMASGFAIIPNIASWLQFNLGYPRSRLGLLYMAGGAVAFFTLRLAGRMVDRFGAPWIAAAGTAIFLGVLALAFGWPQAGMPILPLFVAFMIGNSTRNVSVSSLSTRVPAASERARFLSAQSAVQHLAAAGGAALSAQLLSVQPDGRLGGMRGLVYFCAGVSLLVPILLVGVARRLPATVASTARPKDDFVAAGGRPLGEPP